MAWDLPALVIFRVLGIPDEDVARVKAGADSRLLLMWGRPNEDQQIRLVQGMAAFWRYAETLVANRAEQSRDDFTDLLLARDGDLPALNHQEVTQIVYELLFAGHETTTGRDPCRRTARSPHKRTSGLHEKKYGAMAPSGISRESGSNQAGWQ